MSGGPVGMPFSQPSAMVCSSSQGGPGDHPMGSGRTRSQRGGRRDKENKVGAGLSGQSSFASGSSLSGGLSQEAVAPLGASANWWQQIIRSGVCSTNWRSASTRFRTKSSRGQWSEKKDGRTLIQVIRLVFEKATDEATWSEMCACLCRKMMEQISANVQDDGIKNSESKPIAGGQLFRKYLLNRCQEDFERGWVAMEATAAAAATKATQDQAAKAAAEESKDGESALSSEEYYAAQKAKR
ncbi:hypothetical protein A0H81_10246 [Grifola frondosa]|uniref:MIF4G domain-containing protein n=1 Tax=Grifola frondosa TaxID=5627 RepID=A0A1C7LXZ6_GRIFR|nr:hypothetical protein A0H81_10246 [Grifola frondosa]